MAYINILFDLLSTQPINLVRYSGGAEYTKQIFFALLSHVNIDCKIYGIYNPSLSLDEDIVRGCSENRIELFDVKNTDIERLVINKDIHLFFIGIAQIWFNYSVPKNVSLFCAILDVQDMETLYLKSLLAFTTSFKYRIKSMAKKIFYETYVKTLKWRSTNIYTSFFSHLNLSRCRFLTISEHSKYAILSSFNDYISNNMIDVFWPPPTTSSSALCENHYLADKKYWLLINAGRFGKNAASVIRELNNIKNYYDKYTLVLVGNIKNTIIESLIYNNPNIYQIDYVSREELNWLYKNASLFIYPSFVEGFGYPPVEAMRYGTPVLASATSSIIEVCGDAAIYFCPYSQLELRARLIYLLELLERGVEEIKRKSLERYDYIYKRQKNDFESLICKILEHNNTIGN